MSDRHGSTEALRQTLVQFLMEAIGAPDDDEIGRNMAETVREAARGVALAAAVPPAAVRTARQGAAGRE
ncbi:hypothetical protein [Streptomyces sp. NPDC050560]|uniref:hypothetical protein n=1 Tax=Streptomyces sp. NPDC050560 TaxID=3365630 RepID=UPI0037B0929E